MHDKNSKRSANQKSDPDRKIKSTKTNCKNLFSIKLGGVQGKSNNNLQETYYQIVSYEKNHNHSRNIGFKEKLTDEIEDWMKKNIDPRIYGPSSLQKALFKEFKKQYSVSQLSYLLHKLFHKQLKDIQFLIQEILPKNAGLQYKIGA